MEEWHRLIGEDRDGVRDACRELRCAVSGSAFRFQCVGLRVKDLGAGFRDWVLGLGFRVWELGVGAWGLASGFGV